MFAPHNRIDPLLTPDRMQTYAISQPLATHFTQVGCAETECSAYRLGWTTTLDERDRSQADKASYIRTMSGRRFTEAKAEDGRTVFTFEPGQTCFASKDHKRPLDRPARYLVKEGDWRQSRVLRVHQNAEDWAEDFQEHQDRIAEALR